MPHSAPFPTTSRRPGPCPRPDHRYPSTWRGESGLVRGAAVAFGRGGRLVGTVLRRHPAPRARPRALWPALPARREQRAQLLALLGREGLPGLFHDSDPRDRSIGPQLL